MATDNRKIQLGVTVDASTAKAGFQEVKEAGKDMAASVAQSGRDAAKGLEGVGDGAGASATKFDSATRSLIGSIQRTTAAMAAGSKSSSDYYRTLGEQRGVDPKILQPYLAHLDAVAAKTREATRATADLSKLTTSLGATNYAKPLGNPTTSLGASPFGSVLTDAPKATDALNRVGRSAKETAFALRGVPAQFTDIFTSLQGGQNPLTVLLQQGGQLKDMFGGIGPAARAMGGYVLGLVGPFTVAAGAVGVLTYAYSQGSKEQDAYAKSLILTGNIAGTTAAQLQLMARNIDGTIGTHYQAAEALAALAGSGRVAGADLERFAATAIRIQRSVGTSVQDTTKIFEELGREPVKASEKLNESMNYLTLSVYDQIKALQEQGNESEAASLAQRAYADAMDTRTARLNENLGLIQRSWRAVSDAAKEGWDEILGIGRPDGPGASASGRGLLAAAFPVLAPALAGSGLRGLTGDLLTSDAEKSATAEAKSRKAVRDIEAGILESENALAQKAMISARKRDDERLKATKTRAQRRAEEIEQLDKDAKLLGIKGKEYTDRLNAINETYKDKKTAAPKAYQDDAATRMLQGLREQEASLKAQLTTDEKLTASERERAKFTQQIADLKGKTQLTVEQKSLLAGQATLLSQLDTNVALERQVVLKKEAQKLDEKAKKDAEEFARSVEATNLAMLSAQSSRNDQYERALGAFGMGDRAQQEVEAQKAIRREFERYQLGAAKTAGEKDQLGSEAYKKQVESIKASLDRSLADQQAYFDAIREKQADWANGANAGLQNYFDESQNIAGQMEHVFSEAFANMEDALVAFVTTGKLDFKSLADSIIADISRMIIKSQITGPLSQSLMGQMSSGSGFGGFLSQGLSAIFSGGGGNVNLGSVTGSDLDLFFNAKGGVYNSPGLSDYSGKVVSKPTVFPFARGVGLMGEAGPEAILPLRRGADGKLGVQAGAGGVSSRPIEIHNHFPTEQSRKNIAQGTSDALAKAQAMQARHS